MMQYTAYGTSQYRQHDVIGASPIRLVVMSYDLAIRSCEQRDFARATKSVSVLRDALDFDYGEASIGLFRVYQWCLDCIRHEDYVSASQTLRDLREAWVTVEKRLSPIPPPQVIQQQVGVSAI